MKKQCFNLIEIALAIAIIAIGTSSVLVLFPVGMNASKEAVADNMIPNVADYVLGYVEAQIQAEWRNAAGKAVTPPSTALLNLLKTAPDDDARKAIVEKTVKTDGSIKIEEWTAVAGTNDCLYRRTINDHPVFYYRQFYKIKDGTNETEVTDFSAVILVWKDPMVVRVKKSDYSFSDTDTDNVHKVSDYAYAAAICAEIRYPAEKPYDEQESYLFRREIYNQAQK